MSALSTSAQMVDLNGNGMSDIWEWVYNAYGINPNGDPDGDGFQIYKRRLQAQIRSISILILTSSTAFSSPTNFSVTMPCALGKLYQLQSITNLSSTNWVVETNVEAVSGANVTLTVPTSAVMKFYRVAISDVDSDGSGLMNDWEKYQLGLNPTNAWSNGQQDANGNALSDYAYVTNLLASQNVITIATTDPTATQPDPGQNSTAAGQFTVTRSGFPLDAITVNLGLGGPGTGFATAGLDFGYLPASVTLPVEASSTTVTLTPLANTNLQTPVIAQLQLLPGANYTVGAQKQRRDRHLSVAHGQRHRVVWTVLHKFEHDLHEQQQLQSDEPVPDAGLTRWSISTGRTARRPI